MNIRILLSALAMAGTAAAQPALTIATGGAFTAMDPHFHDLSPNTALTSHVFESLVMTDTNGRPIPGLALSWQPVGPTTWEIKLRPGIDVHDYDIKMRAMKGFLGEGDKVKVTLRFRGREMAHQELSMKVLDRVRADVDSIAKVEQWPKMEGRQMTMVISAK